MPRKKLIYSDEVVYNITNRSNNKEWFAVDPNTCWEIFCENLYLTKIIYDIKIHLLLFMGNHFHFMMSTPEKNISQAMNFMQTKISKEINHISGRTNHVFGGRYKWRIIKDPIYYAHALRYNTHSIK